MAEAPTSRESGNPQQEFAALWVRASPLVFAFIRSMIYDFHKGEDVLQEVAIAASSNFDKYDHSRPFHSWVIGIARNKVLMYLRSEGSDRHVFRDDTVNEIADAFVDMALEHQDRRNALHHCAQKLQGRARKVLEMRYARDLKPVEISRSTGISANTISVTLSRVRHALKDCIERRLGVQPPTPQGEL